MTSIRIETKLPIRQLPKKLRPAMRDSTRHIAEVVQRAAIRNLRQVTDTRALVDSIQTVPSGELNHKVIVGMDYGAKFEKGFVGTVPYSPALEAWAYHRAVQNYLNHPQAVLNRMDKKQGLNVNYFMSKGYRFMSRARDFANSRAKGLAENYIRKVII